MKQENKMVRSTYLLAAFFLFMLPSESFHVSYPDGKVINGRFSGLMKKIKGKWYLYTDHAG